MATQSNSRPISEGICEFCKGAFLKNKMTQHLKSCKQRLASIALQEEKAQVTKTRLFHILAEGHYSPQYWLHFEVPVSQPLGSLDSFLKTMWIDDLDHLSGFTINGTNYSIDHPDDYFLFDGEVEEQGEEEDFSEEETAAKIRELIDETVSQYTGKNASYLGIPLKGKPLPAEWIAEIKKPRSIDELIDYLKEERPRIEKERRYVENQVKEMPPEESRRAYVRALCQKMIVESLLEAIEDRSLEVSLARVLKVGQKFSYVYDYGSSTYINLRVIAEREGIVQNVKKPVQLLAQNTVSAFVCVKCGKPATIVEMGYFTDSIEDSVYCTKCAKKHVEEERRMPIINSPRAGVL
jgi:hypothetical protein